MIAGSIISGLILLKAGSLPGSSNGLLKASATWSISSAVVYSTGERIQMEKGARIENITMSVVKARHAADTDKPARHFLCANKSSSGVADRI